jgi:hypothetical protein
MPCEKEQGSTIGPSTHGQNPVGADTPADLPVQRKEVRMVDSRSIHQGLVCLLALCVAPPTMSSYLLAQAAPKSKEEIMIERMEAVHEIENLMSEYYWWHASDQSQSKEEIMALDTDGTRTVNDLHGAVMPEDRSIKATLPKYGGKPVVDQRRSNPGFLHVHSQASPVIELAADGKTAKGSWISPGLEANKFTPPNSSGYWAWAKFGADFIKENDGWKIWHLHVYSLFMTPLDQSWAEYDSDASHSSASKSSGMPAGHGGAPNAASGAQNAAGAPGGAPNAGAPGPGNAPNGSGGPAASQGKQGWIYKTTAVYPDDKPLPPTPYDTFTDAISY